MEIRPPVEIDAVAGPDDRFKCKPYGAVLLARSCAERQRMLKLPRDQRTGDYSFCDGCKDGPRVAEKSGLISPEALVSKKKNSLMRGKKGRRKKVQPKDDRISPSEAGRAAATKAASAPLPQAPPGRRAKSAVAKDHAPAPPHPLLSELRTLGANVCALEVKTKALLARIRSARSRVAARP
jgi:hypothetical protein